MDLAEISRSLRRTISGDIEMSIPFCKLLDYSSIQLSEITESSYLSHQKTAILLIIGLSSFSYNWVGEPPPVLLQ